MKYILFSLLSACLLFSVGCSSRLPPKPLEEALAYDSHLRNLYVKDENWWHVYGDPQLDNLISTALAANIDFAKTAVAVNKALYQANLIGADLLPTFSATGSESISKPTSTGEPHTKTYSGEANINYELDLWRKLADSASAKEWEYRATQLDRESARLVLINKVVDSYFTLSFLDGAIAVRLSD